jgi:mannan endo-1,4-beta-mannosidase
LAVRTLLVFALAAIAARAHAADFVRTDGTRFKLGDRPFAFVGCNMDPLHGEPYRARYEATLDAARADGLTVARVWALGEGPADGTGWAREAEWFRAGPDGFLEPAWRQLDRVVAAAGKRGLKLIVTLANHWPDYGGVPAYLRWAGLPPPEAGWGARDRFFSDPKTRAFYRAHLDRLLARVNTVTGVRYADDPTIFAWELMNESSVETDEGARARLRWIAEMAELIRARDPHHLITPGVLGYGTRKERAAWADVCKLPQVDYCDSHLYPQTTDEVPSLAELQKLIDDRVQLAHHVAHKPIVFGEFGFDTRVDSWLGRARAEWFSEFLGRVFRDGAEGALVWIYQPWAGKPRDFGIYVDRPDTDDVRAVLRRVAARVREAPPPERNPLLGDARGDRPLYDPYKTAHRPGRARLVDDGEGAIALELAPDRFDTGRFERVGAWDGGALLHAYGAGDGWFEWKFDVPQLPSGAAQALELAARVSSEFPGTSAPPDGGSRVTVSLDGARVGEWDVVPDDGAGRVERLRTSARLKAGSHHVLRLEVLPGPHSNGLCVYGEPTGHKPPPEGESTPLRLTFFEHVQK